MSHSAGSDDFRTAHICWYMAIHLDQHRSKLIKAIHILTWSLNAVGIYTLMHMLFHLPLPSPLSSAGFLVLFSLSLWSLFLNPAAGVLYCALAVVQWQLTLRFSSALASAGLPAATALLVTAAGFIIEVSSHVILQGKPAGPPPGMEVGHSLAKKVFFRIYFPPYFVFLFGVFFIMVEIVAAFGLTPDLKASYERAAKQLREEWDLARQSMKK